MPADKRPLKVFLCHAHSDRDAVKALYGRAGGFRPPYREVPEGGDHARLTRDGVEAWFDKEKPCGERSLR